jgi:hypothetical protein
VAQMAYLFQSDFILMIMLLGCLILDYLEGISDTLPHDSVLVFCMHTPFFNCFVSKYDSYAVDH